MKERFCCSDRNCLSECKCETPSMITVVVERSPKIQTLFMILFWIFLDVPEGHLHAADVFHRKWNAIIRHVSSVPPYHHCERQLRMYNYPHNNLVIKVRLLTSFFNALRLYSFNYHNYCAPVINIHRTPPPISAFLVIGQPSNSAYHSSRSPNGWSSTATLYLYNSLRARVLPLSHFYSYSHIWRHNAMINLARPQIAMLQMWRKQSQQDPWLQRRGLCQLVRTLFYKRINQCADLDVKTRSVPPIVCYCLASILMTVVNKVCQYQFLFWDENNLTCHSSLSLAQNSTWISSCYAYNH